LKDLLVHHLTKPPAVRTPLTTEQIEIRIWAFVVIVVMIVFAGITTSMLYSVIFITQPIKTMAPIDMAFTKMLNDIVLLIVGGIGGIMAKKGVNAAATALTTQPCPVVNLNPPIVNSSTPDWNFMGYVNPQLDESWTPGPPPTTPANYLHPEREEIANERAVAEQAGA